MLVRKNTGESLFNENHAVLAEDIDGKDIQIFNSHGMSRKSYTAGTGN